MEFSAGFGNTSSLPGDVLVPSSPVGRTILVVAVLVIIGSLKSK